MLQSSADWSASPLDGAAERHTRLGDPHLVRATGRSHRGEWLPSLPHPLSAGGPTLMAGVPRPFPSHRPKPRVLTSSSGSGCPRLAPLREPRSPKAGGVCPRRGSEGRRTAAAGAAACSPCSPSCLPALPPALPGPCSSPLRSPHLRRFDSPGRKRRNPRSSVKQRGTAERRTPCGLRERD